MKNKKWIEFEWVDKIYKEEDDRLTLIKVSKGLSKAIIKGGSGGNMHGGTGGTLIERPYNPKLLINNK